MKEYCDIFSMDYFEADVDRSTFYMRRHQGAKVEHSDVSNVFNHRFSHGAVSYTLNGENVNVMLKCKIKSILMSRIHYAFSGDADNIKYATAMNNSNCKLS